MGRRPDIVVALDIGQTCSGVAYSIGPDWSEPRQLNRWPSAEGIERADKVATRIGYSMKSGQQVSWGFEATYSDPKNVFVCEQFKLTLDAEYQDDRDFSCEDARKWYCDYLRCLHRHIEQYFDEVVPKWRSLSVEFTFSTPTTWRNPGMVASIESIIRESGFSDSANQSVRMGLTEAEAAAIEASSTRYQPGDVFLVCDAGGGTTDVNVLKVKSIDPTVELEPLDQVEGVPIGSTLIDFRMAQHLIERLEPIKDSLEGDILWIVDEMIMSRVFQNLKHSFPAPMVDKFKLIVPGLMGRQNFPQAGIENGKMEVSRSTLKDVFDEQVGRIFELMDERLNNLNQMFPDEQVTYIILSGGLGSSPYLFQELQKRYERNVGFYLRNTAQLRAMKVPEPQLAVVRGLVRERTQSLGTSFNFGQDVFGTRRCRNSYGVAVRVPYDPREHQGLTTVTDRHTGKRWVENYIDWMIRRGEEFHPRDGVKRQYGATLDEDQHHLPRTARIVMSTLPGNALPRLTTDVGCQNIVLVSYRLTGNDMTLKNSKPWQFMKKKYWRAKFSLVMLVEPASLRFQIHGQNGVLSSDHESLEVEFMDPKDHRADSARSFAALPLETNVAHSPSGSGYQRPIYG